MLIVLVIFPAMAIMGALAVAVGLGSMLKVDADARFEGTEQLELTR